MTGRKWRGNLPSFLFCSGIKNPLPASNLHWHCKGFFYGWGYAVKKHSEGSLPV